jgi:hypothetical protein
MQVIGVEQKAITAFPKAVYDLDLLQWIVLVHLVWSVLKHETLRVASICVQMLNHIHSSVKQRISSITLLRANKPLDNRALFSLSLG